MQRDYQYILSLKITAKICIVSCNIYLNVYIWMTNKTFNAMKTDEFYYTS